MISDHLIRWAEKQILLSSSAPVLMVSGAQGIGKSTAMHSLSKHLENEVAILGIDDFYLTKSERTTLSNEVHPLFITRGPPGTHDLNLLHRTIDRLMVQGSDQSTLIPRFDKKIDNRVPKTEWTSFRGKPRAIIVEGWLIGCNPESEPDNVPLNRIEEQDDAGTWRQWQEDQLQGPYSALWDRSNAFFHLHAPSFETVLNWRIQQEETTLGLEHGTLQDERKEWVYSFILHYERLTRRMLSGNRRSGTVVQVDENRKPIDSV